MKKNSQPYIEQSKVITAELIADYLYSCKEEGIDEVSMCDILLHLGVNREDALKHMDQWFDLSQLDANKNAAYDRLLVDYGEGAEWEKIKSKQKQ